MTRLTSLLLIVLLALPAAGAAGLEDPGFTPPPRPDEPGALRVMTYNVRYASAASGHEGWETRYPDMAAQLERSDLDILATQELKETAAGGTLTQRADIQAALPGFSFIGRSRSANPDDEQMGVYYREARLEALEHGHFWLSPTPTQPGSFGYGNTGNARMVTWVRFLDEATGAEFLLLNTHFDHASEDARYRAADQIAGYVTGDVAYAGDGVVLDVSLPIVLTGDFNFHRGLEEAWFGANVGQPTTDPLKSLRPVGRQDVQVSDGAGVNEVGARVPVQGNRSSYRRLVTAGPFVDTWEAAAVTGRPVAGTFTGFGEIQAGRWLDWILATPGVEVLQAYVDTSRPGGEWPSDHLPVVADVVIG